jgi:hypothetical protein
MRINLAMVFVIQKMEASALAARSSATPALNA